MNEKVSVIISTSGSLDRRDRFSDVLNSILAQEYCLLEVVVVWQGEPDEEFFQRYKSVTFINRRLRNVCRCRNLGAESATGRYLWFIDDDTTVPNSKTLKFGVSVLESNNFDFLVANVICDGDFKALESHDRDFIIERRNLRGSFSEPGLLFKKECFLKIKFDDGIGIGCIHGSSEGFDLGARLLKYGYKGQVTKDFQLSHPQILADTDEQALLQRIFFYSLGNGKVLITNKFYILYVYELVKCLIFISLGLVALNKNRMKVFTVRMLCLLLGPLIPKGDR